MNGDKQAFFCALLLINSSIVVAGCQESDVDASIAESEASRENDAQVVIDEIVDRSQNRRLLHPFLNCIEPVDSDHLRKAAHFGYESENETTFSEPVGIFNAFYPFDSDQGQPTKFEPGTHDDVVTVEFGGLITSITWKLGYGVERASYDSPDCENEPGWLCNQFGGECFMPKCGDGRVDSYIDRGRIAQEETCDDGNAQGGDGCSASCEVEKGWLCETAGQTCREAYCGDGVVDKYRDADGEYREEECDDGNEDDTDGCLNSCVLAFCGDGVTWNGEEHCDDGNEKVDDGCSSDCEVENGWVCETAGQTCREAYCGDGLVDTYTDADSEYREEECDDGNENDTDGCRNSCVLAFCGDGIIWNGEEHCDDGNEEVGDGCSSDCEVENGWLCETAGQTCREAYCGDGLVDTYTDAEGEYREEGCDDGNEDDMDGCRNTCVPAFCGDGVTWNGEEGCDDGNADETDGCRSSCVLAFCGDGVIWNGQEGCDDGNVEGGDGCSADCEVEDGWLCETAGQTCREAYCGDGIVDTYTDAEGEYREEGCDDGNVDDTDGCRNTCVLAFCGDGVIWNGQEGCDDGSVEGGDGCSADCEVENGWLCETAGQSCREAYCGDGVVDTYTDAEGEYREEGCDDGNEDDMDRCRNSCVLAFCGDGVIWNGEEACDDGNADDTDGCRNSCVPASCGDGVIWNGEEMCDDGNVSGGDGCSVSCGLEPGWICQIPGEACCKNKCIEKDTRCSDMQVQDCVIQTNGCTDWTPYEACPGDNSCIGADCRPGVPEPSLNIDGVPNKALDGNHLYEGDVVIINSSVVSVPTGKLVVRAKKFVLDSSSSITVAPTGRDPRGQARAGYTRWCYNDPEYSYCMGGIYVYVPPGGGGYGTNGGYGCSQNQSIQIGSCCGVAYITNPGGNSYAIADDEIASGSEGGAAGGGYIAVFAEEIQINGVITANGEKGSGCGSGGLVFLRATKSLILNGTIQTAGALCRPLDYSCDGQPLGSSGNGGDGAVKILYGNQPIDLSGSIVGISGPYEISDPAVFLFKSVMPPEGISSSTHPRQNRWYNDEFDMVNITWNKPFTEAEGYYSKANTTYGFVPGPSNADFQTNEYAELAPSQLAVGTNYFHLATVGVDGELGTVESRFIIKINSTAPNISSPTHPNQETWYSDNAPILSWTLPYSPADTSAVYWVIDSNADTVPTADDNEILMDPTDPSASSRLQLPELDDGIWYFHLRARDTMGYFTKTTAHFRLQIDSTLTLQKIRRRKALRSRKIARWSRSAKKLCYSADPTALTF